MTGVSFVIPVLNGERHLAEVLAAILAQRDGRPFEVLVVDDGSTDGSRGVAERTGGVTVLSGEGRGAAAALNLGVQRAAHPIICQVDQDVVIHPGWMRTLVEALERDPALAAAQGRYLPSGEADPFARVSALDLDDRYAAIDGDRLDHVCTGNAAYRAAALRAVGLFDESLGYGYDNDLAYRLGDAGHGLSFCRAATSSHRWREGALAYLRTQYGVGYGRLDVIRKHRKRVLGDRVSGGGMIFHAAASSVALGALPIGLATFGAQGALPSLLGLACLAAERAVAALRTWRRTGDAGAFLFPFAHLLRDAAWAWAVCSWAGDRLAQRRPNPQASMPRQVGATESERPGAAPRPEGSRIIP